MNVYNILNDSAQKWAKRPAIVDPLGSVDYASLFEQVEVVRERLLAEGFGPGLGVGVMGRDSRGFVISMFAALGCGAVVMPISHELPRAEIEEMLGSFPLHAVLDDGSGAARPFDGTGIDIEIPGASAGGCGGAMRLTWTGVERSRVFAEGIPGAAFVRPTSGTTGRPKGVVLSHKGVLERTAAANRGLRISENDRVLWVLPMAFHFFVSIVLYLRYGATILLSEESAEAILEMAKRERATFLYGSPMHIKELTAAGGDLALPDSLRCVVSTSTNLSPKAALAFHARFGVAVSQAYGMIEVGLPLFNLDRALERPESVGRPLPDYEVAILDEEGCEVETGALGELTIRGPGMLAGYLNSQESRESLFMEGGWFPTGDLARRDAEGFVTVLGRSNSVLSVEGRRVFPEEVEEALERHPAVSLARASGAKDSRGVEIVLADVVLVSHIAPAEILKANIIASCRERLDDWKAPSTIRFVEAIEHTRSGKISRHG